MDVNLPENIGEIAQSAVSYLLPTKSGNAYEQNYEKFMKWKLENHVDKADFSENVLLAYFAVLKRNFLFFFCINNNVQIHRSYRNI